MGGLGEDGDKKKKKSSKKIEEMLVVSEPKLGTSSHLFPRIKLKS